jgi:uncharacterized membrane protein YfcA
MEIIGGLIAGGFIGAVLGFIGAGGAMLTVPILLYIFDFTPQTATTAALAVVLSAAISGLLPKIKSKEVLFREASIIWGLGLTTNIAFSILAYHLSNSVLTTGLALVLIIAGTSMLIKPIAGTEKRVPLLWLVLISLVIGMITGLFGIGGGFLAIPTATAPLGFVPSSIGLFLCWLFLLLCSHSFSDAIFLFLKYEKRTIDSERLSIATSENCGIGDPMKSGATVGRGTYSGW